MDILKRLVVEEEGQGIVEYTLMIGLIVLGVWVAVDLLDIPGSVSTLWNNVDAEITGAPAAP